MARLDDRALLARLVAFDTTSARSNLPLVDFLCDYLDRPGVRIARQLSDDGAKANLIVTAGPDADDRAGLVLSGHMDVVPADEPEWRSDPFTLAEAGDRYVGRGTADMKGFLALAANRLAAAGPAVLRRPLGLLFTYDEEVGTRGARHFVASYAGAGELPRDVVIGEPTGLRVVRAHKGMLRLRVTFEGQAAHSGYPHLGRSAIEPAGRAIVALAELRQTMELERPAHAELFPEVPFPALNVGLVRGGRAANVIPDRCELELGIRLLPEMRAPEVAERVAGTLRAAVRQAFTLEPISESPAMVVDADTPLHRTLSELAGRPASPGVMFATDAGWLQRAGFRCVVFGPGSIEAAHRPNEFLPIAEFRRAREVLDRLIARSCVGS